MLLAHSDDGVGEKFTHTGPLRLRQHRPKPTLCSPFERFAMESHHGSYAAYLLYVALLTYDFSARVLV